MAVLGVVATMVGLWPTLGWITPNQYEADTTASQQEILEAIGELKQLQTDTRDEWQCDELDEDLLKLLHLQRDNDSIELQRDIEKIKNKMEALDCSRFFDD